MNLTQDAIAIWKAGVAAVDSENLIRQNVHCNSDHLSICSRQIPLEKLNRIEIVGAGKAGVGMARGLVKSLAKLANKVPITGWVNVPEDCVQEVPGVHIHAARPAGVNEPTSEGVFGTLEILKRMKALKENDLCIVLISGGGSALMPQPIRGIDLSDKLQSIRVLAESGAPIQELNVVRSQLSAVKGGGLLNHATAGTVISLIVSDVIGDPLEFIASGPTTPTTHTHQDALNVLRRYDVDKNRVPAAVYQLLESSPPPPVAQACSSDNYIIGSNAIAVAAATKEAESRGFAVLNYGSKNEGEARVFGATLFNNLSDLQSRNPQQPQCIIAGGETTVQLTTKAPPGKGGRNQEVVLGAIDSNRAPKAWSNIALVSGGTDGEDGPTNAAGAFADEALVQNTQDQQIDPLNYLDDNNAYSFFERLDGLLITGPTHTNVMDLAVGLAGPR